MIEYSKVIAERSCGTGGAANLCCLCNRIIPRERLMSLDQLLPKLIRYIETSHPRIKYMPRADAAICVSDLRAIVQSRLSELVEEDMSQHHKLQDDAMKNMGLFETIEGSVYYFLFIVSGKNNFIKECQLWVKNLPISWPNGEDHGISLVDCQRYWFCGWV
jgi:hypothetical protein